MQDYDFPLDAEFIEAKLAEAHRMRAAETARILKAVFALPGRALRALTGAPAHARAQHL